MVTHAIHGKRAQLHETTKARWAFVRSDDGAGIDGDIEGLVAVVQKRLGLARDKALSELVRTLSLFEDGHTAS